MLVVCAGFVDIVLVDLCAVVVVPSVRSLGTADRYRVAEDIGLVDTEREAVDRVTTGYGRHDEAVLACCIEAIGVLFLNTILIP